MSQAARRFTHVSARDYLAQENDGNWRHEYVDGAVYAIGGASERHNLIRGNIAAVLLAHVPESCRVYSADMKLQFVRDHKERYYNPDVFVTCDPTDQAPYVRKTAVVIFEVLSPTTERVDRTEKMEVYSAISSVQEYGLLSQDAMELELHRRRTGWRREFYQRDNTVTLESINLTISVSSLYRRVVLEDPGLDPSITKTN